MPTRQAIVVPVTTRDRGFAHHVRVQDDGGLARESWAMCEAVRTTLVQRFGRQVGVVDSSTLQTVIDRVIGWFTEP